MHFCSTLHNGRKSDKINWVLPLFIQLWSLKFGFMIKIQSWNALILRSKHTNALYFVIHSFYRKIYVFFHLYREIKYIFFLPDADFLQSVIVCTFGPSMKQSEFGSVMKIWKRIKSCNGNFNWKIKCVFLYYFYH